MTLVTKDPGTSGGFLDSMGALVISIVEAQSRHDIELVALVDESVKEVLPILKILGFKVVVKKMPIDIRKIKQDQLRNDIKTDGCCGPSELMKLWAWTMTEYEVVLLLDADVQFHKNFDELFDSLETTLGWTHGAGAFINQELFNGGFLLIRPNRKHFDEICELLLEGDFQGGAAWKGSGIGWCYGGRTIQGILPYYYLKRANDDHMEYERCKYNNMVEIERCRKWKFDDVTANHFTVCLKPWYCNRLPWRLCRKFTDMWWLRLKTLEGELNIENLGSQRCHRGRYNAVDYSNVDPNFNLYTHYEDEYRSD